MPFLKAPYVHQNNQPKYHAMLMRALEHAKRGSEVPQQVLWVRAEDTPVKTQDVGRSPEQVDRKLELFLQLHDQKTGGIPGLFVLYKNAPVRTTEKIKLSDKIIILKHTSGRIIDANESSECERCLNYLPLMLFVQFPAVTWQLPGLSVGVFPIQPMQRSWKFNRDTGAKVKRRGLTLVNDFASTAFMAQGL